ESGLEKFDLLLAFFFFFFCYKLCVTLSLLYYKARISPLLDEAISYVIYLVCFNSTVLFFRDRLVQTLMDCGYTFQEFMISPTSVGIPNSRLRYFLIAKICGCVFSHVPRSPLPSLSSVLRSDSPCTGQPAEEKNSAHVLYKRETPSDAQRKTNQNKNPSVQQIQDFLQPQMNVDMERYLLQPKTLLRYASILDIVQPQSRRSVCFTKGYGRYVEGTGSVLQCCMDHEVCLFYFQYMYKGTIVVFS
uniref:Uncharacterized protein n=1 Tax=Fundulus heteroclitus TaxID=8078 RepID=A0A3Q2QB47_FUNHE